ncbi:GntR family transcriptional regulator [Rubrobacter xylanophilus]|uniref:GntR family transcriptional regulator n=1 Tax=Rubrobacter xylanophilus TaxID=49319 RepID=A0A510HGZ1_9ACTN|nr:GntR family transcriptional regulator [Rubrobacter xylanophilus]BBL79178.1 GntR family transcriptional regulator [Rubrobacter xylanophilus]
MLERLRGLILEGEYGPGERLIEEQLAEKLQVSRTPIRQALTRLEAEGLVEIFPNKGAMVCSFSIEDVRDIYDLRAVLEGYAARRAAERIGKEELERLGELAGEMEKIAERFSDHEEETRALVSLNNEFHNAVVVASRNKRLERLVRNTVQIPLVFKAFFWYGPYERMISNHYHRQIVGALASRDPERAEILMREHIYEGRDFVIGALQQDAR